jgi:hypothetical protein
MKGECIMKPNYGRTKNNRRIAERYFNKYLAGNMNDQPYIEMRKAIWRKWGRSRGANILKCVHDIMDWYVRR